MPSWALLLLLFIAWVLMLVAAGGGKAVDEARRGVPEGKRGGVSCFPTIPLVPLFMWGVALGIDALAEPWGTWIVASFHGLLILITLVSIVRAVYRLRKLKNDSSP